MTIELDEEEVSLLTQALRKLREAKMNSHAVNPKLGFRKQADDAEKLTMKIFTARSEHIARSGHCA